MRKNRALQPLAQLPVDWSNPITRGLVASFYNAQTDYGRPPVNYAGAMQTGTNAATAVSVFAGGQNGNFAGAPMQPPLGVTPFFTAGSSSGAKAKLDMSQLTKQLTISFWLWWNSFGSGDNLTMEYTANYNSNAGFVIDLNSATGNSDFNIQNSGNSCKVKAPVDANRSRQWHHYAWLIDLTLASSQTVAIYLDGVAQTLSQGTNTLPANSVFAANDFLYFMCRDMASLFATGSIANVNIHSRNMNIAEISSLMHNPHQILIAPIRTRPAVVVPSGGGGGAYRWFLTQ